MTTGKEFEQRRSPETRVLLLFMTNSHNRQLALLLPTYIDEMMNLLPNHIRTTAPTNPNLMNTASINIDPLSHTICCLPLLSVPIPVPVL